MSVVGIDLGTTNTVIACVRAGKVHVLPDEEGRRLLPSVVSFHPNGEVLVGSAARARRVIDPRNTVYSHKRLIGRSWGSTEITQARRRVAFELREGPGQGPLVHARGQDYTLPEISAFVLKRARAIAETSLGEPVERAVITVPAHFNELQRASTKVAGRVSGVEVLRILNEPTAAALAYGLGRKGNERVAVFDLGGGTFDCTLLDLNGNVFEVLATAGDSFLGGDDIDVIIAERMAETYLRTHRYDPRTDVTMYERLKVGAEEVKIGLSTAESHTIVLRDFGFAGGGAAVHYSFTMTRRDLDIVIQPLVDRTFRVTEDALSLARLSPSAFDKVILVGGSTRIPFVRRRVETFFGTAPMDRVNPEEVVAIGAAIQAAALTEKARKRSLPAPAGVPTREVRTLPGLAGSSPDLGEDTQTGDVLGARPVTRPGVMSPRPAAGGPPRGGMIRGAPSVLPRTAPTASFAAFDDFEAETAVAQQHTLDDSAAGAVTLAGDDRRPTSPGDPGLRGSVTSEGERDMFGAIDEPWLAPPPAMSTQPRPPASQVGEQRPAALTASGGPQMTGRPPDSAPPQPFGRMERIATPAPSPRSGIPIVRASPMVRTEPMPERPPADLPPRRPSTSPMQTTLAMRGAPVSPSPLPPPYTAAPEPPRQFGSSPPDYSMPSMTPAGFGEPPPYPNQAYPPPQMSYAPPIAERPYPSHAPPAPIQYAAPILIDRTPSGLVVETAGSYADMIIARNSTIPSERTRRFATGRDGQTIVRVRVAQGEHPHFAKNTFLGEVVLTGLRPAMRGQVVVAVTFEVDADGTLRVRACDIASGQEARAVLQLIGIADESSVAMMAGRFAQQPMVPGPFR